MPHKIAVIQVKTYGITHNAVIVSDNGMFIGEGEGEGAAVTDALLKAGIIDLMRLPKDVPNGN